MRVADPRIALFLNLRCRLGHPLPLPPNLRSPSVRSIYNRLPFAPDLSTPEYVPTRVLSLLRTPRTHFPRHHLLLSDFSSLPDVIPGVNVRVVQARVLDPLRPAGPLQYLLSYPLWPPPRYVLTCPRSAPYRR